MYGISNVWFYVQHRKSMFLHLEPFTFRRHLCFELFTTKIQIGTNTEMRFLEKKDTQMQLSTKIA